MRTLFRHPRRVWHVLSVFFRFFIAPALHLPGGDKRSGPVRMRLAFQRLGGAWIKLGQMLALRFDLLPAAYCDELFKLLNQVEPFSYDEVRAIIRQELGADPETIFQSFSHESFAAASIGQVHRAVLHSGEAGGGQGPAPGHPNDPRGGHRADVLDDPDPRLDPCLRGDPEPGGHRRVRALDGRRARLPRRGEAGRPALPERAGWQGRADRPGPSRLHDVARPDHRADRRDPADRRHDREARGKHRVPRGVRRRGATTWTGSSAPSTGTCSTRSTCSATSTPTCTRPTCSSCRATRSATSTSGSSASCPIASGTR